MRAIGCISSALWLGLFFSSVALADEPCTIHSSGGHSHTTSISAPPPAPVQAPKQETADRLREVGVRFYLGPNHDQTGPMGGSFYLQAHKRESRWGLELSIDAIDDFSFSQAALVRYLKPHRMLSPYVLVGGGSALSGSGGIFQAGGGVNVKVSPRISLSFDTRYETASVTPFWYQADVLCFDYGCGAVSFGVFLASLGVSAQFQSPIEKALESRAIVHRTPSRYGFNRFW